MYSDIIDKAIDMICKGFEEEDVMTYVSKNIERNPYIFKAVWQEILFRLEFIE